MPRVLPRPKFKASDVVMCWMPYSADLDGVPVTFNTDSRLRGGHPAVRARPEFWVLDGTPSDEVARLHRAAMPEPFRDPEAQRVKVPKPIPDDEAAIATDSFYSPEGFVPKGRRLRRTDPLVRKYPNFFRTPMGKLS